MISPVKIIFIVFLFAAASVTAETLYKSVDDKGEVTFSDSPPENARHVEQIEVQPAPTEQQHRESVEIESRIKQQGNEIGDANASRAKQRAEQAPQQVPQTVEPVESYNTGGYYNRRPGYPVRPLPGSRPRPTPLPATRPAQRLSR